MATNGVMPSGSRSRPQARKKPSDDAAYLGPPSTTTKRHATDRAEGEPRLKRKRVDPTTSLARRADKAAHDDDDDDRSSLVNFTRLSTATLHRYLAHFNIVPAVYPSPLTAANPQTPWSLVHPVGVRQSSRALSPPAVLSTRQRRDPSDQPLHPQGQSQSLPHSRRRSSRLLEEHEPRTPVLADRAELHTVLASMVARHFHGYAVNEIDTLASFMVKTKSEHGLFVV